MGTVYIVGAGASKFAGFPLASELLPVLRQELVPRHEINLEVGREFVQFVDEVKSCLQELRLENRLYNNGEPDLEFVLALLDRVPSSTQDYPYPEDLLADLDDVIRALGDSLDTLRRPRINTGGKTLITSALLQRCNVVYRLICNGASHNLIDDSDIVMDVIHAWTNRVQPGDSIITFNWDVLNEMMLWKGGKWHYHDGYGAILNTEAQEASAVRILKLHGSINWALRGDQIYLDDRSSHFFGGIPDMLPVGATSYYGESLIIPSYLKNPRREGQGLDEIWTGAENALKHATQVIVIGYSLPYADYHAREMIARSLSQNNNVASIQVVLVYDQNAFERWEELGSKVGKHIQRIARTFQDFITGKCSEEIAEI